MTKKTKSVFTRAEKIRIIGNQHAVAKKASAIMELVALEKKKIAAEREARAKAKQIRDAMLTHPTEKIKTKKTGEIFFQPRVKGKLQPVVIVG